MIRTKRILLSVLFFSFVLDVLVAQDLLPFIPKPTSVKTYPKSFTIRQGTSIKYSQRTWDMYYVSSWFSDAIKEISGFGIPIVAKSSDVIELKIDNTIPGGNEAYRLEVYTGYIRISSPSHAGIFYGMQTLLQMLPAVRTNAELTVPCMIVEDAPRFSWRGLHLDVSRHFFSPEVIIRYLDLMARYKMNRFHWHLTDDQGWRIEIRRYPELTRTGAWRVDKTDKPWGSREQAQPAEIASYGGFYTQQQIRDIVAYARKRQITIVPEIEMPGHSAAALASYPALGCTQKPQLPMTGGEYSGMSTNYCAGNDSVFIFLRNVLNEVMDLFPSDFIHIGGDEVDKKPWKACERCQARMKSESLSTEEELQSWFLRKVESMILARKRKMIGWDEILEGGLAPSAAVMSWRGESGGIAAANMGHEVVMTPGNPCYFDHYQAGPEGEPRAIGGMNTLQRVYAYEPIPAELLGSKAKLVLGAQANVWTEFITTPEHLEYMILPRMPAMAEVLWSSRELRDWQDFQKRLPSHVRYFEQRGLRYSKGNFKVEIQPQPANGKVSVALSTEAADAEIRYTLDGSEPGMASNTYQQPLSIEKSVTLKALTFIGGEPMGHVSARQDFTFHKAVGSEIGYEYSYSRSYPASGEKALVDGVRGIHAVGRYWHGFEGKDLVATVDLGKTSSISRISLGCLQRYSDWILMPEYVVFEISTDGSNFREIARVDDPIGIGQRNSTIHDFTTGFDSTEARFVRVKAKSRGVCPKGHPGEGKPCWIFADELVVQ